MAFVLTNRPKRFLEIFLLIVGLTGLILIGGKAIANINDRRFVDGVRHERPVVDPAILVNRLSGPPLLNSAQNGLSATAAQASGPNSDDVPANIHAKAAIEDTSINKVDKKELKGLDFKPLED